MIYLPQFPSFVDLAASEPPSQIGQSPMRVLVEAGLIKPQSPSACSPCPKFDQQYLVFNQEEVMQKDRIGEFCQWFQQWPCAVSIGSSAGGSVQCPSGRQQLPSQARKSCDVALAVASITWISYEWFPRHLQFWRGLRHLQPIPFLLKLAIIGFCCSQKRFLNDTDCTNRIWEHVSFY